MTPIRVILSSFYSIFITEGLVIKIVNCIIRIRDSVYTTITVLKMIMAICMVMATELDRERKVKVPSVFEDTIYTTRKTGNLYINKSTLLKALLMLCFDRAMTYNTLVLNRIRLLHCVQSYLNTVSVFEYAATDTVLNVDFSGYKTSV